MSDNLWLATDKSCVLQQCEAVSLDAFSRSYLTSTRHIHHPLVFYSSKLQNRNPKPGFEGVQTRNLGLEIVARVWKHYIEYLSFWPFSTVYRIFLVYFLDMTTFEHNLPQVLFGLALGFYNTLQCSHCKRCTSYGISVRLSHAGIVSKRRHVAQCSLHR